LAFLPSFLYLSVSTCYIRNRITFGVSSHVPFMFGSFDMLHSKTSYIWRFPSAISYILQFRHATYQNFFIFRLLTDTSYIFQHSLKPLIVVSTVSRKMSLPEPPSNPIAFFKAQAQRNSLIFQQHHSPPTACIVHKTSTLLVTVPNKAG